MRFTFASFDDESVVYDAYSGNTHYLSPLSQSVLRVLESASPALVDDIKREELKRLISGFFDIPPDFPLESALTDAVAHLRTIGLITTNS